MLIETNRTCHRIAENSYVTPFKTQAGKLFFIVSSGDNPAEAYQDCAIFEGMTGLDCLAQPRLYVNFAETVAAIEAREYANPHWSLAKTTDENDPECPPHAAILSMEAHSEAEASIV